MTYAGTGVDYDQMDPFKRQAQETARSTADYLQQFNLSEITWSRGGSVYLMEGPDFFLAHVEEGLGSKNLVADEMERLTGHSYYECIARDGAAMIVNDMITSGAMPVSLAMHLAVGSSEWFKNHQRYSALLRGWKAACDLAACAWAGGETSTLRDNVYPETVVLAGSAIGMIKPKERLIVPRIGDGDAIVLLAGTGIHANGLTLARDIAEKLPDGYLTKLPNGQVYGNALLQPTPIYVPVVRKCLEYAVDIHYAEHITGHGWRKLMRAKEPFVYVMDDPGIPPPVFAFMQRHGPISDEEAYGNFNMGPGFALFVPPVEVDGVIGIAKSCNVIAWRGGYVEKHGDEKKVVIPSKNLEFSADSLAIR